MNFCNVFDYVGNLGEIVEYYRTQIDELPLSVAFDIDLDRLFEDRVFPFTFRMIKF